MAGLPKSKVDEILEYLRGRMVRDDDIPRIENLLKRNIEAGAQDDDPDAGMNGVFDADPDVLPRSYGLDSRGRRLVRPASAKDRQAFEAKHGIAPRRIRNLGT